jgi:methyltransferase-like protein
MHFKVSAQLNLSDSTILMKITKSVSLESQIVYVDLVDKSNYLINQLKSNFKTKKIVDQKTNAEILLTKKEKKFLIYESKKQVIWPENLFISSLRISSDSIWAFLNNEKQKQKIAHDEALKVNDADKLQSLNKKKVWVFRFNKPIYIRNNTICLVTYQAFCSKDCGRSESVFYKKENNDWIKWITVLSGDF